MSGAGFDVCAAPFGTRFFFSCRMAEIPAVIQLWQLAVVFVGLDTVGGLFLKIFGFLLGTFLFFATLVCLIYLLRNAVALGLKDLDNAGVPSA